MGGETTVNPPSTDCFIVGNSCDISEGKKNDIENEADSSLGHLMQRTSVKL